jgi:hypothetical protein
VVASLDAFRELHLLRGGQERHPPDVLQEELERVGRDLRTGLDLGLRVRVVGVDDLDLRVVQGRVELVELGRLERELVERKGDLVGVELAGGEPALEQALRLVGCENVLDRRSTGLRFACCQTAPLPRSAVTR